jgi:hypothetical protein
LIPYQSWFKLVVSGVVVVVIDSSEMDQASAESNQCNGIKDSIGLDCKDDVEEDRETASLLPPADKGDVGGRERRNSRRKVQWNDRNGNNLVEVMEFQPR